MNVGIINSITRLHLVGYFYWYIFRVCVCSLRYPACNAPAPCCHPWPAPLYNVFPHYLINDTIFEKESYCTQNVFWFSLQILSEAFLILRRNGWDIIKNAYWFPPKVPFFLSDFNKFFDIFSENRQLQNLMKIRPVWAGFVQRSTLPFVQRSTLPFYLLDGSAWSASGTDRKLSCNFFILTFNP